ncbi:hypothetical protein M9980_12720 [Sphingomonas donggukensis]|uniref:Secreted protein n=1 Tax=Sphingomonas donggukensis TaxID=2949093 RepID=A0ABY4TU59_9SPHN|nr:hypothetical protein [Sphingomonas donggukensis]URW75385.1 hypothetical protein M9980_12720 [Sphingomonas donggukensis]
MMMLLQLVALPLATTIPAPVVRTASVCTGEACRPLAQDRYRFRAVDPAEQATDAKSAALTQRWRECGVMGAPVCPRKGRKIWSMELP